MYTLVYSYGKILTLNENVTLEEETFKGLGKPVKHSVKHQCLTNV